MSEEDIVAIWFERYQESVDPEAEDYDKDIDEFLLSNGIGEYAENLYITDGDRDGYILLARLMIPADKLSTLDQSCISQICPIDTDEEYCYLGG